jgi:hypothetical protein
MARRFIQDNAVHTCYIEQSMNPKCVSNLKGDLLTQSFGFHRRNYQKEKANKLFQIDKNRAKMEMEIRRQGDVVYLG